MGPALLPLLLVLLFSGSDGSDADGEAESVGVAGAEASLLLVALKFCCAKTDSSWLLVKPDSGFLPLLVVLVSGCRVSVCYVGLG